MVMWCEVHKQHLDSGLLMQSNQFSIHKCLTKGTLLLWIYFSLAFTAFLSHNFSVFFFFSSVCVIVCVLAIQ